MKVEVLGSPGTGFCLGPPKGDVYAGEIVEMDDSIAKIKIQQGKVKPVKETAPAAAKGVVDPDGALHKPTK